MQQYKKTALEVLTILEDKKPCIIGVSSSNKNFAEHNLAIAKSLSENFADLDLNTVIINGIFDNIEFCKRSEPNKINDKITEYTYEKSGDNKLTPISVKSDIEQLKSSYDVIIIALDVISNSVPSMLFASRCDGVLLCETKKVSRTDYIDAELDTLKNIGVKPLGFVLT